MLQVAELAGVKKPNDRITIPKANRKPAEFRVCNLNKNQFKTIKTFMFNLKPLSC